MDIQKIAAKYLSFIAVLACSQAWAQGTAKPAPTAPPQIVASIPAGERVDLRVACEGQAVNAEVTVNGVFKGDCPVDLSLREGTIRLRVVKQVDEWNERVYETEFRMVGGSARRQDVQLGPVQLNAAGIRLKAEQEARQEESRQAAEKQRAAEQETAKEREAQEALKLAAAAQDEIRAARAEGRQIALWVPRGMLGAEVIELTPDLAEEIGSPYTSGLVVRALPPGSIAGSSGMRVKDVIVEADGTPISNDVYDLQATLGKFIGRSIPVKVWRPGVGNQDLSIGTIGKLPAASMPTQATAQFCYAMIRTAGRVFSSDEGIITNIWGMHTDGTKGTMQRIVVAFYGTAKKMQPGKWKAPTKFECFQKDGSSNCGLSLGTGGDEVAEVLCASDRTSINTSRSMVSRKLIEGPDIDWRPSMVPVSNDH